MTAQTARFIMVRNQLVPNLVSDPLVLEAMETVERELFVPPHLRTAACVDEDIPLEKERWILEPLTIGRMLQTLKVMPTDSVLDVGCGTGYVSALLSRLSEVVIALESDHELALRAESLLAQTSSDNAVVIEGPLAQGAPKQAPFDVILIEGALAEVPMTLARQLSPRGGRLIMGLRSHRVGHMLLVERHDDTFGRRVVFDSDMPVLPGFKVEPGFVF